MYNSEGSQEDPKPTTQDAMKPQGQEASKPTDHSATKACIHEVKKPKSQEGAVRSKQQSARLFILRKFCVILRSLFMGGWQRAGARVRGGVGVAYGKKDEPLRGQRLNMPEEEPQKPMRGS